MKEKRFDTKHPYYMLISSFSGILRIIHKVKTYFFYTQFIVILGTYLSCKERIRYRLYVNTIRILHAHIKVAHTRDEAAIVQGSVTIVPITFFYV